MTGAFDKSMRNVRKLSNIGSQKRNIFALIA